MDRCSYSSGWNGREAWAGSLLLNLEAPLTALVAVTCFQEHLTRTAILAGALVVGAATALAVGPGSLRIDPLGVILIAVACACWAIDNTVTATLTTRDRVGLVATKAAAASAINLAIAFARPTASINPPLRLVAAALALGAVSYGLSVLLDAYALRALGAAREAAIFAAAPFAGALLSIPILGETLTALTAIALTAMATGAILLVADRHAHLHAHEPLSHDHRHSHDDRHHQHQHEREQVFEPHAHPHRHAPLVHLHPTPRTSTTVTRTAGTRTLTSHPAGGRSGGGGGVPLGSSEPGVHRIRLHDLLVSAVISSISARWAEMI